MIILDNHVDNPTDNDAWHTDVTFIETPPMGSILCAKSPAGARRRHPVVEHEAGLQGAVDADAEVPGRP